MIARGFSSMTMSRPAQSAPGEQHRRFELCGRDRRLVDDRVGSRAPAKEWQRPSLRQHHRRRSGPADRECAASGACAARHRHQSSPGWLPPAPPIISRLPVPELPKSSGSAGVRSAPMPLPLTRQEPSPTRSTEAPSARQASPVRKTSSPSSTPSIRVSPTLSSPRMKARCEIDLSPGGLTRPVSGPLPRRKADGALGGVRGFQLHGAPDP